MEEGTAAATRMLESDTVEPQMIDPVIVGEEGNEAKSDLSIHDQAEAVKDADLKRKQEELSKLLKRASSLVKKSKFIDDNIASHSRSADRALRAYKVMQAQKVKTVEKYQSVLEEISQLGCSDADLPESL